HRLQAAAGQPQPLVEDDEVDGRSAEEVARHGRDREQHRREGEDEARGGNPPSSRRGGGRVGRSLDLRRRLEGGAGGFHAAVVMSKSSSPCSKNSKCSAGAWNTRRQWARA